MTFPHQGRLGWWAARFLAAAGVSSVACSGHYTGGGGTGDFSASGYGGQSGIRTDTEGGGTQPDPMTAGGETSGAVGSEGGASGGSPVEPSGDNRYPCLNPVHYGNADSGLELCDNGMLRRVSVGTCEVPSSPDGSFPGCLVDADCPPISGFGSICLCDASGVGRCAAADCTTDDDCADDSLCMGDVAPHPPCGFTPLIFACKAASDECVDCAPPGFCGWSAGGGPSWTESSTPTRACANACGAAGRPFLIDSFARTARTAPGCDWLEPSLKIDAAELTAQLRAHLAAHWQHQAEMEHASVAAFARFVLELLSLGAPSHLVSAATSALADETAHARLCYALASSYAGQELGPTKLNVTGALAELGLSEIVTRAVLEGCVGETLAAIEASEAASHATDETLRAVLSQIAEDEARHAELSWRFVRWALLQGGAELRAVVRDAFAQARGELSSSAPTRTAFDAELLGHGVLSAERRARLAAEVFATVIGPCADALSVERMVAPVALQTA